MHCGKLATMTFKRLKIPLQMLLCYSIASTIFLLFYDPRIDEEDLYSESDRFFLSKNAIIIGTVKDGAATLPPILSELDELSNHFNHTTHIIFESNSYDNTLDILLEWQSITTSKSTKVILNDDKLVSDVLGSNLTAIRPKGREEVYVEYRNMMLLFAKKTRDFAIQYLS